MVGLGAGARSYTRSVHYSSEYAVGRTGVLEIIRGYLGQDDSEFDRVDYGFELDVKEQQRRYILKSLLRADGLALCDYRNYFGSEARSDFPQLDELLESDLALVVNGTLQLLPAGLDLSDAIGPWFYSDSVKQKIVEHALE